MPFLSFFEKIFNSRPLPGYASSYAGQVAQGTKHTKKDSVSVTTDALQKLGELCAFALRLAQGLELVETVRDMAYP